MTLQEILKLWSEFIRYRESHSGHYNQEQQPSFYEFMEYLYDQKLDLEDKIKM